MAENRRKAVVPRLRGNSFKEFETFRASIEKYFSDWFGFRDDLIRTHNLLHVRALQTSPLAAVVIGRDGWLYYNADDSKNLPDYCGLRPFTEKNLDAIERNLTAVRDELRLRGIAFAVLVTPSKHTIYPEHLPERVRALAGTTRLDQLVERLGRRPDILFVDVRRALLEGKARHQLYFRTDTHWNSLGAHLAARKLLSSLVRAAAPVPVPHEEDLVLGLRERLQTDLAAMLGLPEEGHEQDFRLLDRNAAEGTIIVRPLRQRQSPGRETRSCETGRPGLRFFLVQDSFGSLIIPSLCREYSSGVSVWGNRVLESSLDEERPDIVILEVAERFLGLGEEIFLRRD